MTIHPPNPILEAALAYAARGWRVFPCDPRADKPHAKRPLVLGETGPDGRVIKDTGWPKQASCDPDQIKAWWRRWPHALIGMAPGWAHAFVVDLDPKGESVEEVEARLVAATGAPLPATPRTITQSGGRHLWFRRPPQGAGNDTPGLKNIDIRCDAGYVIVPPSVMTNGNAYRWEGAPYESDAPPVPLPLLSLIAARRERAPTERAPGHVTRYGPAPALRDESVAAEARRRYARAALDRIVAEISSTGAQRGTAIYSGACQLGRFVAAGALSEREAVAGLEDAAEANGLVKDDGHSRVMREIRRGLDEGAASAADVEKRLDEIGREAEARRSTRRPEPPPIEEDWSPSAAPDQVGDEEISNDVGNGDIEPSILDGDVIDQAIVRCCAELDQSDTDNGLRLRHHFGEDLVVRRQEGGRTPLWVNWCGTHWDDVSGAAGALRLAQRVGPRIAAEARFIEPNPDEAAAIATAKPLRKKAGETLSDEDEAAIDAADEAQAKVKSRQAARRKFAVSSKNASRVNAMLNMAAPHLLVDPETFNADPLKVATPTQTLIFSREIDPECPDPDAARFKGAVRIKQGHRREDMITRLLPFEFDPEAPCPGWLAFTTRFLPNEDVRRMAQVAAGLGLLGLTEQVLVFHYGFGANGKSAFLEAVSRVLGPLAVGLPAESISGENARGGPAASPDIARLFGARFVRIAEVPEGTPLQEDLVKRMTGGERFPVRNLFEGFFEFDPVFIAHMSGNGYPRITGTDNGIWRRMAVINWPVTLDISEQRNFHEVVDELLTEAPGILRWLVDGALIYLTEGLVRPDAVVAETAKYRGEMDPVGRFFASCVTLTGDDEDTLTGLQFYEAYQAFALAAGDRPVSNTRFGRDASKRVRRLEGNRRLYLGVKLHDVPRNPHSRDDDYHNPNWEPEP